MPTDRFQRHLVVVLYGLALITLVLLLPDLAPKRSGPTGPAIEAYRGRIEQISTPSTTRTPISRRSPSRPSRSSTARARANASTPTSPDPSGSQDTSTYSAGQEVVVTITKTPDGSQDYIEVSDRWRLPALGILALFCAIAVVVVGGWQGLRALVALGLTAVIILKILLPLMIAGVPPVPLAVLTASGVTVVTILMTEGWRRTQLGGHPRARPARLRSAACWPRSRPRSSGSPTRPARTWPSSPRRTAGAWTCAASCSRRSSSAPSASSTT